ncbi:MULTISPECIES: helix-turn-helix domain-containing protein [Sphingobacterium]|uniref:AraC-like DNA-binding protein n=2 Tax=Sphingobacterium TaxID=28453 RepID=A0A4R6WHZ9_9SPHI|nr:MULTISPECIES: AraC family transcriptional regulator [Sphingobacterium]TDQ78146.1 AraC-like DNA-binding protein [Sphingobacterium yanglingense]
MKKTLHYELSDYFGAAVASKALNHPRPRLSIRHADCSYFVNGEAEAIEQEFDGHYGYLYSHDLWLEEPVSFTIQVDMADLHVLYLMDGQEEIYLLDALQHPICTIAPGRARYLYLPEERYYLSVPESYTQLFGFYFDGQLFRQGNERPFRFLHALIEAYRREATEPQYSIDFRVGPRTKARIQYLLTHLESGQLNTERFVLDGLTELLLISRDKVLEEYEMSSAGKLVAEKVQKLLQQYVAQEGQEFRLSQLGEDLQLSMSYIKRAFLAQYKQSLSSYKNDLLLEKSKLLLALGTSISAVAYDCGYNSLGAFCHFFKKQTGITAQAYIQGLDADEGLTNPSAGS